MDTTNPLRGYADPLVLLAHVDPMAALDEVDARRRLAAREDVEILPCDTCDAGADEPCQPWCSVLGEEDPEPEPDSGWTLGLEPR